MKRGPSRSLIESKGDSNLKTDATINITLIFKLDLLGNHCTEFVKETTSVFAQPPNLIALPVFTYTGG